jgi:hypothetical protein
MVGAAGVVHPRGITARHRSESLLERETPVARGVHERPVDIPQDQ